MSAMPNFGLSRPVFLAVDLCSLCLRINDPSLTMFVAAALFGDEAAGVVLRSQGGDRRVEGAAQARIGGLGASATSRPNQLLNGAAAQGVPFVIVEFADLRAIVAILSHDESRAGQ
jgi:alkylresorcinol/alkylpyrone synthase